MSVKGRALRFIVDVNVGRLATWLRAMGYDTLYIPQIEDNDFIRIAYKEGRTAVTRDTQLAERRLVTTGRLDLVLIRDQDLEGQIRQLAQDLALTFDGAFSLCLRCNETLTSLPREEARPRVPEYVYRTQKEFEECAQCCRVYWRGTHWSNMRKDLARMLEGVS